MDHHDIDNFMFAAKRCSSLQRAEKRRNSTDTLDTDSESGDSKKRKTLETNQTRKGE